MIPAFRRDCQSPPGNEDTAIFGAAAVSVKTNFAPEDCTVNKCKWLLCVLMAMMLTAGSTLAQDAKKPKKKKPARAKKARPQKAENLLRGEYGVMASEVKLTDEQKAKFVETLKAQSEAKKAMAEKASSLKKEQSEARKPKDEARCKELGDQLKALQKEQSEARKPKDEARCKELGDQLKALQKEFAEARKPKDEARCKELEAKRKELQKELAEARKPKDEAKFKELGDKLKKLQSDPKADKAALMAILTDAQKADWDSFTIYRDVSRKFGKAKLTEDQKKAIRDMCSKADVKTTGDKKADAAVLKGLAAKISADVLTDEQRTAMEPKARVKKEKKDKPVREKKPRAKKKGAEL